MSTANRQVKSYLLSSSVGGLEPARLRQLGIERLMTKPIIGAELLDTVLGVMEVHDAEEIAVDQREAVSTESMRKILLAEDGVINQRVAIGFQKMGSKLWLSAMVEALDAVKREVFDLALMDIQMPEMNGLNRRPQFVKIGNRAAISVSRLSR
ncbi:MAG: hypothetical protein WKF73_14005 [Nocardioidaceae bacterium]